MSLKNILLSLAAFALMAQACFATVPSTTAWAQYTLTTNPQTLPVPYVFTNSSDLLVLDTRAPAGPVVLTQNSDYLVSGGGGTTGSIATIPGGAHGVLVNDVITIIRGIQITQTVNFTNTGPFTAAMVGQAFDKAAEISQQLNLGLTNSLHVPPDEVLDLSLPLTARKSMVIGFDSNGAVHFYTPGGGGEGGGSVTSILSGAGLTGGPITTTGTLSQDFAYSGTYTGANTFEAGSGFTPLTVLGFNGHVTESITGGTGAGASFGELIAAGTNASDYGLLVNDATNAQMFKVDGAGQLHMMKFYTTQGFLSSNGNGDITTSTRVSLTFDTIAGLRAWSVSGLTAGQMAIVGGYYANPDPGGGLFSYNPSSSTTDDGGIYIAPNAGPGRWVRQTVGTFIYPVAWFGARGDNASDDHVLIQNAINAAVAYIPFAGNSPAISFTEARRYNIGSSNKAIQITSPCNIYGNGAFLNYTGTGTNIGLWVNAGNDSVIRDITINQPTYSRSNPVSSLGGIGIQQYNASFLTYYNVNVIGFAVGWQFEGDGAGCSYTNVFAPFVQDCGVGFDFVDTGIANSSCTNIRVFGGTLTIDAFSSMTGSRNIRMVTSAGGGTDGIVFNGTTCEGSPERKLLITGGWSHCEFNDLYWDSSNGGTDIEIGSAASAIVLYGGADLSLMVISDSGTATMILDPLNAKLKGAVTLGNTTVDQLNKFLNYGAVHAYSSLFSSDGSNGIFEGSEGTSSNNNWLVTSNYLVGNAYEFIPSTATGGTTFTTATFYLTPGQAHFGGKVTTYNGATVLNAAVTPSNPRLTGQTAAQTLTAYTVGASDGSFRVSANVNVTAATTANFTVTCTYTDETNASRVLTLGFVQLSGATLITAITNTTGTGPYESPAYHIRAKAGTTITFATAGTFTTVTYNVEGLVEQLN